MSLWRRETDRPLVIGHRGSSRRVMENTIDSFRLARDEGADGVELDVRLCASGEVVVFHDTTLERLAEYPHRIDEMSWSEISKVRLRSGEAIPTLFEVLTALSGDFLVNVELKAEHLREVGPLIDAVLTAIGRDPMPQRFLLSSFHPACVWRLAKAAPQWRAGLLFARDQVLPLRGAWVAHLLRPAALHPEHVLVTPSRLADWNRRGTLVNTWTVDDPVRIQELARWGVNAVITNDPALARQALASS